VTAKVVVVGAGVLGAVALLLLALGVFSGGIERVSGTRAGNLDGSGGGVGVPMRRGGSEMIGDSEVKNVGNSPILIESIEPLSTSPELHVTKGRIWALPAKRPNRVVALPMSWRGWPPKGHMDPPNPEPSWRTPTPDYLKLPTTGTISPGGEAQLVYGIFLHADPSPKLRITGVQITFKQDGRTIVWTKPDTVGVMRCTPYYCGH
jgi:hypothetical protein